jgi:hypothetical protein
VSKVTDTAHVGSKDVGSSVTAKDSKEAKGAAPANKASVCAFVMCTCIYIHTCVHTYIHTCTYIHILTGSATKHQHPRE